MNLDLDEFLSSKNAKKKNNNNKKNKKLQLRANAVHVLYPGCVKKGGKTSPDSPTGAGVVGHGGGRCSSDSTP